MNIHVSECKYYCLHLVPKFGNVRDCQNWRLHPTATCARPARCNDDNWSHGYWGCQISPKCIYVLGAMLPWQDGCFNESPWWYCRAGRIKWVQEPFLHGDVSWYPMIMRHIMPSVNNPIMVVTVLRKSRFLTQYWKSPEFNQDPERNSKILKKCRRI